MSEWGFLTSHGLVLAYIVRYPENTVRQMAAAVKTTEWTVHKVLRELEESGYIKRYRVGRHNTYQVNPALHLRHDMLRDVAVGGLLAALGKTEKT